MSTKIDHSLSPDITVDWASGLISGPPVEETVRTLGQLTKLFQDQAALHTMDPATEIYRVQYWKPVAEGTLGGLFWGSTILQPGRVGDEYFMTHGHFHAIGDRAEFYATVRGRGLLLLMDENGVTRSLEMKPGRINYIPGHIGHRAVNTGDDPLVFVASWPSDAGHDYERIQNDGFGKRVVLRDGGPCLI